MRSKSTALIAFCWVILLHAAFVDRIHGQTPDLRSLTERLDAQEREIAALRQQLTRRVADCHRLPIVAETSACDPPSEFVTRYYAGYDKGLVIQAFDQDEHPFRMKIAGWAQFRHVAFSRDTTTWTDNAGIVRPVRNRNAFDVERARLTFGGRAFHPKVDYFVQLDGDTDGREVVDFFDYWWGYRVTDRLRLQFGKRKVTASRQWLLGARRTRFIDRPMANDFFRPDRTVGIFAQGDLGEHSHFEMMVGNGLRTAARRSTDLDDRVAWAGSWHIDPMGDFGGGLTDYAGARNFLARFGVSYAYSTQTRRGLGVPAGEADFVRLADGTVFISPSALTPGIAVDSFDIHLLSLDAAARWRGMSMNAEYFARWLENIEGVGPLPSNVTQHGYYLEGGVFLIPKRLDVNVRYSMIEDAFGNAQEWVGGFNYFPFDTQRAKLSLDVADITRSPLQNTASEILAGDDGRLIRSQIQFEF